MACINRENPQVKSQLESIAKQLDTTPDSIAQIINEHVNRRLEQTNGTDDSWPSVRQIADSLYDAEMNVIHSQEQAIIYFRDYVEPRVFDTLEEAMTCKEQANKIFPNAVGLKKKANGKYEVKVSAPVTKSKYEEMLKIKKQAVDNGTFMKAPNGKDSNLNEKQWLQVRTKAFKKWFGDWENPIQVSTATAIERAKQNNNELYKKILAEARSKGGEEAVAFIDALFDYYADRQQEKNEDLFNESALKYIAGKVYANNADAFITNKYIETADGLESSALDGETDAENEKQIQKFKKQFPNQETKITEVKLIKNEYVEMIEDLQDKLLQPVSDLSFDVNKIQESIYKEKSVKDCSTVVDENGEPLVVYKDKDSKRLIFTEPKINNDDVACFLNARDKSEVDESFETGLPSYEVYNINQVKSAESNLGNFSKEDDSITDNSFIKGYLIKPSQVNTTVITESKFFSGDAKGSDKYWAAEASKLGIKTTNYTVETFSKLSEAQMNSYEEPYKEVCSVLHRPYQALFKNNGEIDYIGALLRRNMQQAESADAIFAVGTVGSNGYVAGGTGYATTRGILDGKPVYLYDQVAKTWKVWDKNTQRFENCAQPKLTKNACTIGTRDINEYGQNAIRDILSDYVNIDSTKPVKVDSKILENPTTISSDVIEQANYDFTRNIVSSNPNTLYVFTDNTDRTSGRNPIDKNSPYYKKYGNGTTDLFYPNVTQAQIRGMENALPISTQRWYHKGASGETGRWTDNDVDEFEKTIDAELQAIRDAYNSGKYQKIVFGRLFEGKISQISLNRADAKKLYSILKNKLVEYGFEKLVPNEINKAENRVQLSKLLNKDRILDVVNTADDGVAIAFKANNNKFQGVIFYKNNKWQVQLQLKPGIDYNKDLTDEDKKEFEANTFISQDAVNKIKDTFIPKDLQDYIEDKNNEKSNDEKQLLEKQDTWQKEGKSVSEIVKLENQSNVGVNATLRDRWGIVYFNEHTNENNYSKQNTKNEEKETKEDKSADILPEHLTSNVLLQISKIKFLYDWVKSNANDGVSKNKLLNTLLADIQVLAKGESKEQMQAVLEKDYSKETNNMALNQVVKSFFTREINGSWNNLRQAARKIVHEKRVKSMRAKFPAMDKTLDSVDAIRKENRQRCQFNGENGKHEYIVDGKVTDTTVTTWVHYKEGEEKAQPVTEGRLGYFEVSTNIGTPTDVLSREYFEFGERAGHYNNMSPADLQHFEGELDKLTKAFDEMFGVDQYEVITDEDALKVYGVIANPDGSLRTVAGIMDIMVIDKDGNRHVFDFKTYRSNKATDISGINKIHYSEQVNIYAALQVAMHPELKGTVFADGIVKYGVKYESPTNVNYQFKEGKAGQVYVQQEKVTDVKDSKGNVINTLRETTLVPLQDATITVTENGQKVEQKVYNSATFDGLWKLYAPGHIEKGVVDWVNGEAQLPADKQVRNPEVQQYRELTADERKGKEAPKTAQESENDRKEGTEEDPDNLSNSNDNKKLEAENEEFQKAATTLIDSINEVYNSEVISTAEVRHIGEQIMYRISDFISEIKDNPQQYYTYFHPEITPTQEDLDNISSMSRKDIVQKVGIKNLMELCKERVFNAENNTALDENLGESFDLCNKLDVIYNNFDAIARLAVDTFTQLENFAIVFNDQGEYDVKDTLNTDEDNFNETNDKQALQETKANDAEGWQVDVRTKDVMNSMTQTVKQEFLTLPMLKEDNGNIVEVKSEYGITERVNGRDATNSILRWTQGAVTLQQMIDKIKAKESSNPWVANLLPKLEDKTGQYSDFQSQFFSVMCKHFQSYSVVIKEGNTFKSIQVNEHPALSQTVGAVKAKYKLGNHPLFIGTDINVKSLNELNDIYKELREVTKGSFAELDFEKVCDLLGRASAYIGADITPELVNNAIDKQKSLTLMIENLKYLIDNLSKAHAAIEQNRKEVNNDPNATKYLYDPFNYDDPNSIGGNVNNFLKPITDKLEDIAVSSFYDSGKMYQSYVTPSYLTKLFNKFHIENEAEFEDFLKKQYLKSGWFYNGDVNAKDIKTSAVLCPMLQYMLSLNGDKTKTNAQVRKELLQHKVQLNFNKHNYMKDLNDSEYVLSVITECFSDKGAKNQQRVPAWFRIPMQSNKPSSEFIKCYRYTGAKFKDLVAGDMFSIFCQELKRIQTCLMRESTGISKTSSAIKNFDKNGKKFNFLDFMNDYMKGGKLENSELGKLLQEALEDPSKIDPAAMNKMMPLVTQAIKDVMQKRSDETIAKWEKQGIIDSAKKLKNVGKSDAAVRQSLEEFVWNDALAAMNILELTVTDIAYYKDAEDLQKRLAQIHAPGVRANTDAVDYDGNDVSDGNYRTIILKDFDNFKSNIIDNLNIVFDRKIADARKRGNEQEAKSYEVLKDSLTRPPKTNGETDEGGAYWQVNVADAQGYSSITSYRKKAFMFGRWSKEAEALYKKIEAGDISYTQLKQAFQPLKPFVYSQIMESSRVEGAPIQTLNVPTQFKNSEYLLIMADAILKNEHTGKPNLLRAINRIMEESAKGDITKCIDTIQFESTTKSGLEGVIDIKQFYDDADGEEKAYQLMKDCIYSNGTYSDVFVRTLPFEDYCIQQEVPEHFLDHEQAHGSQLRYIIASDLETVDTDGNEVKYDYYDPGDPEHPNKSLTAKEFREVYEQNIARNIEESIKQLRDELGIPLNDNGGVTKKQRNIAISKILQREILSSPRYGVDLLLACSVDEEGNFRIPLGDPVQSKRVEQLLNSIIKNRVNKQEIPGGPVVQVSNFGTSTQLNIRFKDKNGNLLLTKSQFAEAAPKNGKSHDIDAAYKAYIDQNQAGIAYYECFAPIYSNELLKDFIKEDGSIDIEEIEQVEPDLLKMIGYRIPTEDKYSMAPLKIVGFLPREAGDGIMLPNDITTITGSDFDVDKFYLMRKSYKIQKLGPTITDEMTEEQKAEEIKGFNKNRRNTIASSVAEAVSNDDSLRQQLEDDPSVTELRKDRDFNIQNNTERINNSNKTDEEKQAAIKNLEETQNAVFINKAIKKRIQDFESTDQYISSSQDDEIGSIIRKSFLQQKYQVVTPTEGKSYRDNLIIDMSWSVLTHSTTADKILNPGGFEQQKKCGYVAEAFRKNKGKYTIEELRAMDVPALKNLCYTDKNLTMIDTHVQFYKQNAAAGTILGIFAIQKVGHAALESDGWRVAVGPTLESLKDGADSFTLMGKTYSGDMEFDKKLNDKSELIGKILGSLVASAADAVKDPVLNLMNINGTTVNVLTTAIRFGQSFEDISLFLSTDTITQVLNQYNKENLSNFTTFDVIIKNKVKELEDKYDLDENSPIMTEELTEEEVQKVLLEHENDGLSDAERDAIDYKVLKTYQRLNALSRELKGPTYATRFNSISNAVGPLVVDNLIMTNKMNNFCNSKNVISYESGSPESAYIDDIFKKHPILNEFQKAVNLAQDLLGPHMLAYSQSFNDVVNSMVPEDAYNKFYSDRELLSALNDFYSSYYVLASGALKNGKGINYYINNFPEEFMNSDAKTKYSDNLLINSIRLDVDKNSGRAVLKLETTGMDTQQKEAFSNAWIDLHKKDPKLSEQIFLYNFYRGGVTFNPKTFMALVPTYVKERIFDGKYKEAFSKRDVMIMAPLIKDQFYRNNWMNNKIVPFKKLSNNTPIIEKDGKKTIEVTDPADKNNLINLEYFKVQVGEKTILFKANGDSKDTLYFKQVDPLGNNGEYLEISEDEIGDSIVEKKKANIIKVQENPVDAAKQETKATEETKVEKEVPTNPVEQPAGEVTTNATDAIENDDSSEVGMIDLSFDEKAPISPDLQNLVSALVGNVKGITNEDEAFAWIDKQRQYTTQNPQMKTKMLDQYLPGLQKCYEAAGIKADINKIKETFEKYC